MAAVVNRILRFSQKRPQKNRPTGRHLSKWNDPWLQLPVWLKKLFCAIKGHFCSVLLSNIIGYLRFYRLNASSPDIHSRSTINSSFISLQREALMCRNCLQIFAFFFGSLLSALCIDFRDNPLIFWDSLLFTSTHCFFLRLLLFHLTPSLESSAVSFWILKERYGVYGGFLCLDFFFYIALLRCC